MADLSFFFSPCNSKFNDAPGTNATSSENEVSIHLSPEVELVIALEFCPLTERWISGALDLRCGVDEVELAGGSYSVSSEARFS